MPLLIEDADTNIVGEELATRGGRLEVKCWADTWDGAQVEIEEYAKSTQTETWISLRDTVTGTPKIFNSDEQAIIDIVATNSRIRPKLTGAGGSTANVNCEIRSIS